MAFEKSTACSLTCWRNDDCDKKMKNCFDLEQKLDPKYKKILEYDKKEIDNPDRYDYQHLTYNDRIDKVMSIVKGYFPVPKGIREGEFGCGQGNMS